jgi:YVTN family beta-propeller protein
MGINYPNAIAVNPTTNKVYVASSISRSVSVIDEVYIKGSIAANIPVGESPEAIAVDPNTNKIYVAYYSSDSVSVIDGANDKVLSSNITAGISPIDIAVNPTTNKVYVVSSDSRSVSVIDEAINDLVALVTFNIHPFNAGHIKCNNDNISTNVLVWIRSGAQCKAEANNGFVFSSWSEDLGHNSSKTITTSPVSDSWTSLLNAIGLLQDNSTFTISEYGNFIANFREAPSPIPPAYLLAIFGFILSVIVPSILRWISGYNQRRSLYKYLQDEIDFNRDNLDQDTRRKKIMELYTEGKISASQRKMLEERISQHYKASDTTHME